MYTVMERTQQDMETIAFFERMAPKWDEYSVIHQEKVIPVLQVVGISRNARMLDVACGTGALFPYLFAYAPEALVGIDISPAMAAIAANKYDDPRLTVRAEDFHHYEETGFDLITLYNAYPHFPDRERFVSHARSLLRPHGRLLIFHGNGRARINGCHTKSDAVKRVSTRLRSCAEESMYLRNWFEVDVMLDAEHLYVLSGKAR